MMEIARIYQDILPTKGHVYTAFTAEAAELCLYLQDHGYIDVLNQIWGDPWIDLNLQYAACTVFIAKFMEGMSADFFPVVKLEAQHASEKVVREIHIEQSVTKDERQLWIECGTDTKILGRSTRYWRVPGSALVSTVANPDVLLADEREAHESVTIYERAGDQSTMMESIFWDDGVMRVEEPPKSRDELSTVRLAGIDEVRLYELVIERLGNDDFSLARY